jgi:CMP-N,N'-diacetyllegionaminic acid synthase
VRVLAVIPARCGSTRIAHKNIARIGDYTLVQRALHSVSGRCDDICVSTDCVEVVCNLGPDAALVMERRCGPDGPMVDVLLEAARRTHVYEHGRRVCRSHWDAVACIHWDAVACIQPTSPFRRPEDIDGCIALLEANPEARSVVSVNEETNLRNGACYITRVDMLRDGLVFDEHSLKYPMPAERSLDINEPADLELARKIAKERGW